MTITYNSLTSAIIEAAEDDSAEFLAYIPKAIDRAEVNLTRALDTYGFDVISSTAMSIGDPYVSVPSGTFIIRSVDILTSGGNRTDLLMRTREFCKDYWPIRSSVGIPKFYAWKPGAGSIYVVPTPTSAFNNEWVTVQRPTPITSANQTNWFTDHADEALFYFSMMEVMDFAKNPKMHAQFEAKAQMAVAAVKNEARRTRRDDQAPNTSPAGGDNTIDGAN